MSTDNFKKSVFLLLLRCRCWRQWSSEAGFRFTHCSRAERSCPQQTGSDRLCWHRLEQAAGQTGVGRLQTQSANHPAAGERRRHHGLPERAPQSTRYRHSALMCFWPVLLVSSIPDDKFVFLSCDLRGGSPNCQETSSSGIGQRERPTALPTEWLGERVWRSQCSALEESGPRCWWLTCHPYRGPSGRLESPWNYQYQLKLKECL